jgi:hypothetical protein
MLMFVTSLYLISFLVCFDFSILFLQQETRLPRPRGAQRLHHRVAHQGLPSESIARTSGGGLKVTKRSDNPYGDDRDSPVASDGPAQRPDDVEHHWEVRVFV